MSISSINSSTLFQLIQNSLSAAGLAVGNQSSSPSTDAQSGNTTISPFQQALQTLTSPIAQPPDSQQSLSINGTQRTPHHHHHHSGGEGNQGNEGFIDQLAQSLINDLQQIDGTADSSIAPSSNDPTGNGLSFLDGLTSALANSSLTQYQSATDAPQASSSSPQVNAIA